MMNLREEIGVISYFARKIVGAVVSLPVGAYCSFGKRREEYELDRQLHEDNCRIWDKHEDIRRKARESARIIAGEEREEKAEG